MPDASRSDVADGRDVPEVQDEVGAAKRDDPLAGGRTRCPRPRGALMRRAILMMLLSSTWLTAGCATAPGDAGFGDVSRDVSGRAGVDVVHWDQGTDADREAQSSV